MVLLPLINDKIHLVSPLVGPSDENYVCCVVSFKLNIKRWEATPKYVYFDNGDENQRCSMVSFSVKSYPLLTGNDENYVLCGVFLH